MMFDVETSRREQREKLQNALSRKHFFNTNERNVFENTVEERYTRQVVPISERSDEH